MLSESLPEYLHTAEYCIRFTKDDSWPPSERGGCLGYPAAGLLFAIADAIGSYHRNNATFRVRIDGQARKISSDGFQHFYVLNSDYYGQNLSAKAIKSLYDSFRSILHHNAAIAPGKWLRKGDGSQPFPIADGVPHVDLLGFLNVSQQAVKTFRSRAESVVQSSAQAKIIRLRR